MYPKKIFNCKILEDYFNYLTVVKARSVQTLTEYKTDLRMLFEYMYGKLNSGSEMPVDCSFVDIDFIKFISLNDIYSFIAYCQNDRKCSIASCNRKIISFRQFWRYLNNKVHLIESSMAEEMELPQLPKRVVKYLDLDDSMRLLIGVEDSPRDYCIITIFVTIQSPPTVKKKANQQEHF